MSQDKEIKIDEIHQEPEPKQLFWKKLFPSDWNIVSAIVTFLGIAGGLVALYSFTREQPNISLSSPIIKLESILPTESYVKRLEGIENKYGGYTEYKISSLIDQLRAIESKSVAPTQDPQSFYDEFNGVIAYFENIQREEREAKEMVANKLSTIKTGLSSGQASANLALVLETLGEIQNAHGQYTETWIYDLMQKVDETNLDAQNRLQSFVALQDSLNQAIDHFSGGLQNEDGNENPTSSGIPGLVNELKELQSEMEVYKKAGHEKIHIELSAANQSRLKNLIHDKAMITFYSYSDYDPSKEISRLSVPLEVISPSTIIDDYGLIKIELESKDFATLDTGRADSFRAAFEDSYRYIVVAEDLHGKLWYVDGQVSTGFSTQPEDEKRLENESERLLKKIVSQ